MPKKPRQRQTRRLKKPRNKLKRMPQKQRRRLTRRLRRPRKRPMLQLKNRRLRMTPTSSRNNRSRTPPTRSLTR